jgi:hypothetical protein
MNKLYELTEQICILVEKIGQTHGTNICTSRTNYMSGWDKL